MKRRGRWWSMSGAESFRVIFEEPVRAVTPGQAAVVYDGDRVLGGGWIERSTKSEEGNLAEGFYSISNCTR